MTIPYDPKVPALADNSLATSQPQILNNFSTLYEAFLRNHIPLDSVSNAGNHTIIELLQQENPVQTDINELSVYSKDVEGQTDQVFMRFQNNGTEFQFTNYQIYTVNDNSFFTFIPGKVIVYFGTLNPPRPGNFINGILELVPPVARNIFSVTANTRITATTTRNRYKPLVDLVASSDGIFRKVTFTTAFRIDPDTPPLLPLDYIIMANI